jgi:hypothetical protein
MTQSINAQLVLAVAILIAALGAFAFLIYTKVTAVYAMRGNAPWIAVGVVAAAAFLYFLKS